MVPFAIVVKDVFPAWKESLKNITVVCYGKAEKNVHAGN